MRGFGMNFDIRFGALLNEKTDSSGLIARKILINDSSGGKYQRKFFVRRFVRRIVFNGVKLGFFVRVKKFLVFKKTRRAGMFQASDTSRKLRFVFRFFRM